MKYPILYAFLAILLNSITISAQSDSTSNNSFRLISIPQTLWDDFKTVSQIPLQWKDSDWALTAIWGSGGGMVLLNDRELFDAMRSHQSQGMDKFSKYLLEPTGSGLISIPLMGIMWAGSVLFENDRLARTSMLASRAWLMSFLSTGGLKLLTHRSRPYESNNPMDFSGPGLSTNNISFPSGHTATAFAAATVFASEYSEQPLIGIAAYSLAGLVAFSRIYDGEHWPSDVIFGAGVGYAIGRTLSNKNKNNQSGQFTIFPVTDGRCTQVCLSIRF